MARMTQLIGAVTIAILATAGRSAIAAPPTGEEVIAHYADLGQVMYGDAAGAARDLDAAIGTFLKSPTDETLKAARQAWIAARVPYMQTEVFRFGNPAIDDIEGRVNSWPLDEGLIDYVDASYGETSDENPYFRLNIIANTKLKVGRKTIDARKITPKLLEQLQEAGEVEANVATGYHAVEFLLWGQDLHGTGPGAGERPATDYDPKACTHGHCDRRAAYLKAASQLLVRDLGDMTKAWDKKGAARRDLAKKDTEAGLSTIFTGLGSLSYGELAGERMKLGLLLHDPEEEHDCFSDNTFNSHYYDIVGMKDIWEGRYVKRDGTVVAGPSLKDYAETQVPTEGKALTAAIDNTLAKAQAMKDMGDSGKMAYDQMIGEGNAEGNKLVQDVIDALVAQTRATEVVVAKLGLTIKVEGSDSLDDPSKVGQ